ncbi:septum formation inhibitor Maf [Natronosporangium hydrolyticum]|uniref:Nucleoside triphosphate pyrophosphatase n=1 Tax=Natronosporangium hydrolyticum TaxID=2811111 RepID=A0A895YGS4_9ACTN|nr:nucleoside triphosphate pyrophosphatase [Natronosporangium hydrolyticum]QSB15265.1 septum formation inhibitor Maf [Natronosporangium hydrolyticum]
MSRVRLVLASASPARRRTLTAAGIDPEVIVSGVDESSVDATKPEALCAVLARMKAQAVADRLRHGHGPATNPGEQVLVLGCDTVLGFDGEALGKPADEADALARWRQMSGGEGVLYTGHALLEVGSGRSAEAVAETQVHFAELTDAEIEAYVATGEPLAVAGAFTIDGLGGPFVERIDGDPGTVIGLSLPLLRRLLRELDLPITELWRGYHPE